MNLPEYILVRNFQKKDFELLKYWINEFNFYKDLEKNQNKKKISNKTLNYLYESNKLKIIIKDNIRIGAVFKNKNQYFYFFSFSPFILQKLSFKILEKLNCIPKYGRYSNIVNVEKKNFNLQDIYFNKNLKIEKKNFIRKVLILGPTIRNKKIISYFKSINIFVKNTDKPINRKITEISKFDLIISSGYAFKINKKIINIFKNRIINLHATFLPWGKGIGTTFFSLLRHEPTGISLHFVDSKFDTGKIIMRKKFFPNKFDTTRTFYEKLIFKLNENFIKLWPNLSYINFNSIEQKSLKSDPKYFSRLDFEKIIEKLPNGYDTKVFDLVKIGYLIKNNQKFKSKIL
ncbi:MAG: hypothetical protein CMA12_08610 [Euryarchaeota archaeon]|nr:hypothetical protein [Euryarchaeota archaeon]